ncbi:hypothetical protein AX15_003974 [Amanita polypyramis BW_CC]|nr:hypothetical protein AX15_003974 [Amanita polypyramis BW_CC]
MDSYRIPPKLDLTPKRHHGYAVLLFIMGTLFPPLAVAARFGIGKDFWLNLLLTICGYIPGMFCYPPVLPHLNAPPLNQGHGHNFYIQNIRNNKTHARTPKWAQRYGLVDTSEIQRKQRKSQWATRYNERTTTSALEGLPYEEGQIPDREDVVSQRSNRQRKGDGELWREDDESYYAKSDNTTSGRWRYPANFDDAALPSPSARGKKKEKKNRWARTEDAYSQSEERSRRKKSKKKRTSGTVGSLNSGESVEVPEDPDGGHYGHHAGHTTSGGQDNIAVTTDDLLNHEV